MYFHFSFQVKPRVVFEIGLWDDYYVSITNVIPKVWILNRNNMEIFGTVVDQ